MNIKIPRWYGNRGNLPRVVGVIGDTQHPFNHPNYLQFCYDTFVEHEVTDIVHIGDLNDNNAISDYENSYEAYSVKQETQLAREELKDWVKIFPNVKVCWGNHDDRFINELIKLGLSEQIDDIYRKQFNLPSTWEFAKKFTIDGVRYKHKPAGGKYGFINTAINGMKSTVTGHAHSVFGIKYVANEDALLFGMGVGCGIDIEKYAFDYTEEHELKPIMGCGIVKSSTEAYCVPMTKKYLRS